jgi:hypothetical protein
MVLSILLAVNIYVTINDDLDKKQELSTLAKKLNDIKNESTGGDTYCYFIAVPNMGAGELPTYPLTVWVKGTYPMRNTTAQIQTVYDDKAIQIQSIRNIPLGDGTLLPGPHFLGNNFRVPIGEHIITISSRRGLLNQSLVLSVSNGKLRQTGDVWGDGKKLDDIANPKPF